MVNGCNEFASVKRGKCKSEAELAEMFEVVDVLSLQAAGRELLPLLDGPVRKSLSSVLVLRMEVEAKPSASCPVTPCTQAAAPSDWLNSIWLLHCVAFNQI